MPETVDFASRIGVMVMNLPRAKLHDVAGCIVRQDDSTTGPGTLHYPRIVIGDWAAAWRQADGARSKPDAMPLTAVYIRFAHKCGVITGPSV